MKKVWEGVVTVKGERVGSFEAEYNPSQFVRPLNKHMFCPSCGDKWASLEMPLAQAHAVLTAPCEACGGGILWLYFGRHVQKVPFKLSREVLERDFMILSDKVLNGGHLHSHTKLRLL